MPLLRRLLPALLIAVFLGPASVAHATGELTQKPGTAGCISNSGSNGLCQDGRALYAPAHVVVSQDGRHVYAAGSGSRSVAIFDRDAATGALTQSGCISSTGNGGDCETGSWIRDAGHLALSPDGRSLYVSGDSSIAVLDRDPATGRLAQKPGKAGCITADGSGGACDKATPFDDVKAVAISSDGRSAYAAALGPDALLVFDRDAAGALTQKPGKAGCLSATGTGGTCEKVPAVGGAVHVALTADGRSAYVAGTDLAAVAILDRDPATGELTSAGCIAHDTRDGCRDGGGFGVPSRITVSADDRTVYVGAGALAVFERDAASRALTQRAGLAIGGALDLALSPDGLSLYAAQTLDGFLRIADRDAGTGALAAKPGPAGCVTATGSAGACGVGIGTITPSGVAVSGDGRNVYVTGLNADSIAIFDRATPLTAPPPPAPSAEPPAADRLAPTISGVRVTRRARVRFTLSERASVRIVIERVRRGRVRTLRIAGRPGRNVVKLRRALAPGRYRATITATDAAGNRSAARRARFR